MLFWPIAPSAPITIESSEAKITTCCHAKICAPNASRLTRISRHSAATLGAVAKKVVTGVGAPSYTSGVHMWNGAALILNARPASTKITPNSAPVAIWPESASWIPAKLVVPVNP